MKPMKILTAKEKPVKDDRVKICYHSKDYIYSAIFYVQNPISFLY